jgi:hypothetical protein
MDAANNTSRVNVTRKLQISPRDFAIPIFYGNIAPIAVGIVPRGILEKRSKKALTIDRLAALARFREEEHATTRLD